MSLVKKYLVSQLRQPHGLIGRVLISRVLNRVNFKMNALTLELLDVKKTDRILEVGFGGGALLEEIVNTRAPDIMVGADISTDMVDLCTKKLSQFIAKGLIKLDCTSVESLPYKTNFFTKICSVNTLYFWEDISVAIKEIKRVLTVNGLLVITFNDKEALKQEKVTRYGFNLFSPQQVQKTLETEGFIINQIRQGIDETGKFYSICAINKT